MTSIENRFWSAAILAAFLFSALPGHADAPPALIVVDAAQSPGPVNRLIFGHNMDAADTARIFGSDTTDTNLIATGNGFWDPVKQAPVPEILERCHEVGMSMLRYPGGCLAHNFDWRKAVGPLEQRGDWKFGIDEYLTLCHAIGAEPMFTVSDYVLPADEMPAHAAGLVEYLNAPATPDHPWAMKRKEWGHPDPYGVKWFELGNESVHGNHRVIPFRKYTPEEYADYANATAAAMRAVDPSIKIGIVMVPGDGSDIECLWNRTVLRLAGKSADYVVIHLYAPKSDPGDPDDLIYRSCMAVGEQSERHLDEYRAMALRESGRDLPLAVTEFNGRLSDNKPNRFTYAEALECADLLRIFLQPEHHVLTANYWLFLNGYFGMLQRDRHAADGEALTEKPAYPLYCLWGRHFGTTLVSTHVDGPHATFEGNHATLPASGDSYVPSRLIGPVASDGPLYLQGDKTGAVALEGGGDDAFTLRFENITGKESAQLGTFRRPEEAGNGSCEYEISFEARFTPAPGSNAVRLGTPAPGSDVASLGLKLLDSRGWDKTHSGVVVNGITTEWQPYWGQLFALPDAPGVNLLAQYDVGLAKVSGHLEVRNFHINAYASPQYPAYALLTSCASTSADGKTLYLMVFNKSDQQDIPATVRLDGYHAKSAKLWEVNGPSLGALDGVKETIDGTALSASADGTVQYVFPAHSMTAIEFSN